MKLWCIAIALGEPANGMVVVSVQTGDMEGVVLAKAVSDVYLQTGTKLPLMGVNARELTREYLEEALKAMDEPEPGAQVTPLRVVENALPHQHTLQHQHTMGFDVNGSPVC